MQSSEVARREERRGRVPDLRVLGFIIRAGMSTKWENKDGHLFRSVTYHNESPLPRSNPQPRPAERGGSSWQRGHPFRRRLSGNLGGVLAQLFAEAAERQPEGLLARSGVADGVLLRHDNLARAERVRGKLPQRRRLGPGAM